jgi:hypothetical protein
MSIGTKADLFNAANGKMPQRVFTNKPTTSPVSPKNDGMFQALGRKGILGQTFPSLAASNVESLQSTKREYQPYTSAVQAPATRTFADVLARTGRTSTGSGKYGGFNNAGDLSTAISGAAINVRDVTVPQLRSAAGDYYSKLDKSYRQSLGSLVPFTTEYNPGAASAANFRIADQLASNPQYKSARTAVNAFMPTLGSWYGEQAKPAEEYLQTAQQLEMTPLSQLASSIATRGYGMDPNLAAGKFANLDSEYFQRNRDNQYMQKYGMPYDQYTSIAKEQKDMFKETTDQNELDALSNIESITGFSYNALAPIAGQTKLQMYDTMANNYTYKDPVDNVDKTTNGAGVIAEYRNLLANGKSEEAQKLMDEIDIAGAEGLGLLLRALQNRLVTIPSKASENAFVWGSPIGQ